MRADEQGRWQRKHAKTQNLSNSVSHINPASHINSYRHLMPNGGKSVFLCQITAQIYVSVCRPPYTTNGRVYWCTSSRHVLNPDKYFVWNLEKGQWWVASPMPLLSWHLFIYFILSLFPKIHKTMSHHNQVVIYRATTVGNWLTASFFYNFIINTIICLALYLFNWVIPD